MRLPQLNFLIVLLSGDPSKLILRLNQIGIDGALLKWFLSYASIKVQLYADDIKVYGIYGMENKCEIHAALTESIRRLMEWTNFWSLPVNLSHMNNP